MRYIKKYEDINVKKSTWLKKLESQYSVGSYILVKMIPAFVEDINIDKYNTTDLFAQIIDIEPEKHGIPLIEYTFRFYNGETLSWNVALISRKLTKSEIKTYEARKEAFKYNL